LASTSPARREGIISTHPGVTVHVLPGGDEDKIPDVVQIAEGKVNYARQLLENQGKAGLPVIGADTMTFCYTYDPNGGEHRIILGGHGKTPLPEVANILREMREINQKNPHIPQVWAIDTGAAAYRPNAGRVETRRYIAWAELDPNWVEDFLNGDGAETYLRIYHATKDLPRLSLFLPNDPELVSGGLAFEPLFIGGAIQKINGVWVAGANPGQLRKSIGVSICVGGIGLPPEPTPYCTGALTEWGEVTAAADFLMGLRS
jgi:hypothetical protein